MGVRHTIFTIHCPYFTAKEITTDKVPTASTQFYAICINVTFNSNILFNRTHIGL